MRSRAARPKGPSLWVFRKWAGQGRSPAHYGRRDRIPGGPWWIVSRRATRCNAQVAFCFLIIHDCLTVKTRTLFVLREQIVVSGFLRGTGHGAVSPFSQCGFHRVDRIRRSKFPRPPKTV